MYLYYLVLDTTVSSWVWRHKPLDSALQRQRQMALCESEPSLVYIKNSGTVRATERDPDTKTNNNNKTFKKYCVACNGYIQRFFYKREPKHMQFPSILVLI